MRVGVLGEGLIWEVGIATKFPSGWSRSPTIKVSVLEESSTLLRLNPGGIFGLFLDKDFDLFSFHEC